MIRPDHPAVRAMAEEMAREMHDSYATIHRGYAAWDDLPDYEATLTADDPDYEGARVIGSPRRIYVDAHVWLLTDFDRPATRDAWARWLAQRRGLTVGSTAPSWCMVTEDGVRFWELRTTNQRAAFPVVTGDHIADLAAAVSAALETA